MCYAVGVASVVFSVRLDSSLVERLDAVLPAGVSRNRWIAEAIAEKFAAAEVAASKVRRVAPRQARVSGSGRVVDGAAVERQRVLNERRGK